MDANAAGMSKVVNVAAEVSSPVDNQDIATRIGE
jgi:hypothetical protein